MKRIGTLVKPISIISLLILLAASIIFLINGWLNGHFTTTNSLRSYVASFGIWAPLTLTLIQILQVILPVLPGFMGCIVGAALFGAAGGFLTNYIGISLGSIAAYWLAKYFGFHLVNKMISLKKYESHIERLNKSKRYSLILFLSILLPLAPDDFLCYFSGLINMPPRRFILIILFGKPWCILLYSLIFA